MFVSPSGCKNKRGTIETMVSERLCVSEWDEERSAPVIADDRSRGVGVAHGPGTNSCEMDSSFLSCFTEEELRLQIVSK